MARWWPFYRGSSLFVIIKTLAWAIKPSGLVSHSTLINEIYFDF